MDERAHDVLILQSLDQPMLEFIGDGVATFRELADLQGYLIDRRLYRVSVETPREAYSQGNRFKPILPEGGLQVQVLDPDDPIARALDE